MNDIYKNTEGYNPKIKQKILMIFDDMIAEILSNQTNIPNSDGIVY